jgi:hypothetical protein
VTARQQQALAAWKMESEPLINTLVKVRRSGSMNE